MLALLVLCGSGCGDKKNRAAAADTDDDGFPRALAPVGGVLAGEPFSVGKLVFRDSGQGQRLELYSRAKGSPCAYQSAFSAADRYLQIAVRNGALPFERGKPRHADLIVVYKRSGAGTGQVSARMIVDEIDVSKPMVKGRLLVSADDNTDVRGTFEATRCTNVR